MNTEFYRISSDFFVWSGNRGVCDLTDLPPEAPINRSVFESFDVCSSKTGKVISFIFEGEITEGIGCDIEIVGWRYYSEDGHFAIDILND